MQSKRLIPIQNRSQQTKLTSVPRIPRFSVSNEMRFLSHFIREGPVTSGCDFVTSRFRFTANCTCVKRPNTGRQLNLGVHILRLKHSKFNICLLKILKIRMFETNQCTKHFSNVRLLERRLLDRTAAHLVGV